MAKPSRPKLLLALVLMFFGLAGLITTIEDVMLPATNFQKDHENDIVFRLVGPNRLLEHLTSLCLPIGFLLAYEAVRKAKASNGR